MSSHHFNHLLVFFFSLCTPLQFSDLDKIHDGIGDKVSLLIQWIATLFGGLVIAFASSWKVSLLVLAFVPILAICGSGSAKEVVKFEQSYHVF